MSGAADSLRKWALPDGVLVSNLVGHNSIVNAMAVNDEGVLVSAGDDGSMKCVAGRATMSCIQAQLVNTFGRTHCCCVRSVCSSIAAAARSALPLLPCSELTCLCRSSLSLSAGSGITLQATHSRSFRRLYSLVPLTARQASTAWRSTCRGRASSQQKRTRPSRSTARTILRLRRATRSTWRAGPPTAAPTRRIEPCFQIDSGKECGLAAT